eukprot:3620253-Rhodomonas_salina.2
MVRKSIARVLTGADIRRRVCSATSGTDIAGDATSAHEQEAFGRIRKGCQGQVQAIRCTSKQVLSPYFPSTYARRTQKFTTSRTRREQLTLSTLCAGIGPRQCVCGSTGMSAHGSRRKRSAASDLRCA